MKKALLLGFLALVIMPFSVYATTTYISQPDSTIEGSMTAAGHSNNYFHGIATSTISHAYIYLGRIGADANGTAILQGYADVARSGPCSSGSGSIVFTFNLDSNPTHEKNLIHGTGSLIVGSSCYYYLDMNASRTVAIWGDTPNATNIYITAANGILFPLTGQELLESLHFSTTTPLQLNISTSSSFFSGLSATSTLNSLNGQCSQAGNIFSEGICTAFAFLFIPNTETINQYNSLNELAKTKIPFYYVSYIQSVFSNFSTTTSSNLPLFSIPLHNIASSTLTGPIPDLSISTTTISTYLPDWARLALQALLTAAIWLAVGWHVYKVAMNAPPR